MTLKDKLGVDVWKEFWDEEALKVARFARHSIAHTGGRAKEELLLLNHSLFLEDGIITVTPSDNRALFSLLKAKVTELIELTLPEL